MTKIDYFFTLISPFSYLGHAEIRKVAARHGADLVYRPMGLMGVWEHSGGVPLPQRPKPRQETRLLDLQRWRVRRGVPLNLHPKHFPTNPTLADRSVIALVEAGVDPADYMDAAFRAVWAEDRDIADREVLAELLAEQGHDAEAILAAAESDSVAAAHKAHTEAAVDLKVIGAPCYVLNGEPFWGQDRIELLDDALTSGREPYAA